MKRRDVLAGVGATALFGAAGCLGVAGLDEHEATPAGVDPDVRASTGYEQTGIEELVIRESVDLPGMSDEVVVTNYLTEHDKGISLGPLGQLRAAVFTVLTSPQISIVGRELNPIAEMEADELTELLEADYDDISNIEYVDDDDLEILDQETRVARYEADAVFQGQELPVYIHISESIETSADHLVTIGVYPQQVRQQEAENIEALMRGVIEAADETESRDSETTNEDDDTADEDTDDETEDADADDDFGDITPDDDQLSDDENLTDLPDGVDVDISLS